MEHSCSNFDHLIGFCFPSDPKSIELRSTVIWGWVPSGR